ncbi:hypothetical protein [Achromobacter sp. ESBL13]|uniref:hypothetical protein n=1 Tax=Achromobacter sp. ESBL13 TaxID=3077328 RepID=UPI002FCB0396
MNRIRTGRVAIALVALCVGAASRATPLSLEDARPWPEVETVQTLLRADAAAALADCRVPGICPSGPAIAQPDEPTARQVDAIRVAAIYGSARRLNVDVVINGALLRYRAGHHAPVAGAYFGRAYQLLAVEGACVHLRRDDLDHTACVDIGTATP